MIEAYLLTFNCARNLVNPETLTPSLFDALPKAAAVPDVLAVSLQEVAPIAYSFLGGSYLKPYFDRIATSVHLAAELHSHGSERLEHVATRSLGLTALMIFAKPQFMERIQYIQAAGAGVGVWNMGNKGAVAMRIGVSCPGSEDLLNITFVAAHLAPHEKACAERNKNWEDLVRNMVFTNDSDSAYSFSEEVALWSSAEPPAEATGLFHPSSHLFVTGDLNYRTHDSSPGPEAHETYPQPAESNGLPEHFSHLLEKDQLNRERKADRTLHGLQELPIEFPPTYKYSARKDGSSQAHSLPQREVRWEWAIHRYPSWCDRILFLPSPLSASKLEPQVYTALSVQSTSDHRPVALSVRIDDAALLADADDIRSNPPFPINPEWKARRDAGRRREVAVGVLSYLALTKEGNVTIAAILAVAVATSYLAVRLLQ
ncbi:DNase I-like protein [Bimuria novae-zelandiae CBS 107.79]|uniref:DNase I-like protein n=1 Tax=Bimuria novae-zelandiae CBS 107.79 TaxID=1447943 RepID=A0A6A5UKC6_9PLEO|nr:DNase I-like protein [Bimuria novae-zelandiae CBS 107.79]